MTVVSKMASEDQASSADDPNECPLCERQVYQAEAVLAANRRWHKRCFKCIGCNQLLSTATCNVWQSNLFCKHCLAEASRPKSPMLYAETTTVAPMDESNACPRCKGAVFQAEAVIEKGLTYHKRCFTCINCHRPQTDKLQVFVGFDHQLYCKTCYPKIWHTPLPMEASNRSKIKAQPGDESGCPRCNGKVFEAEKMASKTGWFHKLCFTCKICNRLMDYTNYVDYKGDVYCKGCYRHNFESREYSNAETGVIKGTEGDFETCPNCKGVVFEAEKVVSKHNLYHKSCLGCFDCKKKLDASNFFDANDGHIYCRQCYSDKYGSRGRAKSVGPTDHQKIPAHSSEIGCCRRCSGRVFEAEKMTAKCGWFHRNCFKCFQCNKILDASNYQDGLKDGIFCRTCYKSMFDEITTKNTEYARAVTRTNVIQCTDPEVACPRCQGVVFDAEKMAMRSGCYHKKCFTCFTCNRNLDYLLAVDGPQAKNVYCQSCYIKTFGPTEQKYNTVSDPKAIQNGSSDQACPRCQGTVFHAEEVWAKGRAFHKSCSTCVRCNKRLDSLSLNSGPDGEIYCKTCHETHFGSHKGHPGSYHDVKSLKANDEDIAAEKCVRCHGKVFDLEKVVAGRSRLLFHKVCLTCSQCQRSLNQTSSDATRTYAFEPPESMMKQLPPGSIYCQRCHVEKFEDVSGNVWYDSSTIKDAKGCPRCGGAVFQAEEIIEKGISFHKKCFTCCTCRRPLNDKLQVFIGFDQEVYCKVCYPNITHTPLPLDPKNRSKVKGLVNDPDACPRCLGKVFEAEKVQSKGKSYHKDCFTCLNCSHILSVATAFELLDDVFCKTCYTEKCSDGKNHYMSRQSIQALKATGDNDAEACIRCNNKAFEHERVLAKSGPFHKSCLACYECSRQLDISSYFDGRDGGVYCKNCYGSKYGYKGRSQSAARDVVFPAQEGDMTCPGCSGKIFDAEKLLTQFGPFHLSCFKCVQCKKSLVSSPAFKAGSDKLACKQCIGDFQKSSDHEVVAKALTETNAIQAMDNDPDKCPKCNGKVFDAEKMQMSFGNFHKKCFACSLCNRKLDHSNACHNNTSLFCNNCYLRNYGPVGVKYQLPTEHGKIKANNAEQACPRCQGAVYEVEKVQVKDRVFHKNCTTCKSCSRQLDAGSVYSLKLQDKYIEIFCQGCYSRFTGVAGFRGANTTMWVDEKSAEGNRPSAWSDPSAIKATNPQEACLKCNGTVYELERQYSKCGMYHKVCFKCDNCSKKLESLLTSAQTYVETQNNGLFCLKCFEETFGSNAAPNIYAETSKIMAVDGKGCPRCKGAVYHAEEIIESGHCYHKQCFTCKTCKKNMGGDRLQACIGFDKELYCKTCCPKLLPTDTSIDSSKIKGESAMDSCPQCKGKVFEAEKIMSARNAYHKSCFKCKSCSLTLDVTSVYEGSDGCIFCKNCYIMQNFSGKNSYMAYVGQKTSIESDPSSCLRCKGKVFEAEKVPVRAGLYHTYCLKCHECAKQLEATSFLEARDKFIYCGGCYSVKYGVRSRARSCGPMDFRSIKATDDNKKCLACSGQVFESEEKMATPFGLYHKACLRCATCNLGLTSADNARKLNNVIYCKQCFDRTKRELASIEQDGYAKSFVQSEVIKAMENDPDQCPRCKGKVFPAEMVSMKTGHFHKKCFTCCNCKRALDASNACDGPNKDVFCNSCYQKYFGPMKRWFEQDKSVKTDIIKSVDGHGCPRCNGIVYEAEKVMASESRMYHKKCCSCKSCQQKLDSGTLCNGPDKEIYCQNCHTRKFGGAGFRGSMASTWVDEESASMMRPCQNIDPSKLKISNDPDSCMKCQGKVYEMERISSKSGVWHRQCFTCIGCKCSMTNTLDDVFDRGQGQIYCRPCLKKYTDLDISSVKPMTYSDTKKIPAANEEDRCPKCQGAVFEAEKLAFSGKVFHQGCFGCFSCKIKLDSLNAYSVSGKAYCKACYNNLQASKRPSTPKSMMTVDASDPTACLRCGCKVYEQERISSKNGLWHRQCFTCSGCKYSMTNTLDDVFDRGQGQIYCRPCLKKHVDTDISNFKPMIYSDTKKIPASKDEDKCPRCEGAVFEAEKVAFNGRVFHQGCFGCSSCKVKLDSLNAHSVSGKAYCKTCYNNLQSSKRPSTPKSMITTDASDPTACLRCGCKVYEAEKMMSKSRLFHKQCFTCSQCHHTLDYSNCMEGPNNEIYCKTCYVKEYFTGGRNKFGDFKAAPTSSMDDPEACPKCSRKVYEMERVQTSTHVYHKQCLSCQDCSRVLDYQNYYDATARDGNIYCKNCYENKFGVKGHAGSLASDLKKLVHGDLAQLIRCHRCGGNVYEAEKISNSVGAFHPGCFKCLKCSRALDQASCFVGDERDIFCQKCYNEDFSNKRTARPRSRMEESSKAVEIVELSSEDIVAQSMVDTAVILAEEGDKNRCPRCNGKVFEAEKCSSNKGVFHRKCFTCQDCHRALDSYTVNDGPEEGTIFCGVCYQRKFGPTVRVAGADHAANEEFVYRGQRETLQSIMVRDATPVKLSGNQAVIGVNVDTCIRCSEPVYDAEKIVSKFGFFHQKCFNCNDCHVRLDSSKACELKTSKEVYCKNCYNAHKGLAGYGYGAVYMTSAQEVKKEYHFTQFF